MKPHTKIVLAFLISLSFHLLNAQHYTTLTSTSNHLYEVNNEWVKHQNEGPDKLTTFHSENDRIRFHLKSVIDYLSKHVSDEYSTESQKKRFALLKRLEHYADQKVFPKNSHHSSRRPYFIDHEGTHCAVGYLMAQSGSSQLAKQINLEHNYDYIRDIKTKGVTEWAKQNGFSLDELALIQPGYAAQPIFSAIDNGINGPVKSMIKDHYRDQVIFAGQFGTLNNLPCLNIGIYKDEQLSCLGEGIEGVINNILFDYATENIVVTGALVNSGTIYPMAIWNDSAWSFYSIPGREGAICSTSHSASNFYLKQLAISHPSMPGQQEIWVLKASGEWEKKATIDGVVFDIEPTQSSEAYVGHFNTVTHHRPEGDTSFTAHNIVMRDYFSVDTWFSIDSESSVSDTIKVAKKLGATTYFGGTCLASIEEGGDDICLTRYLNGVLQPVILSDKLSLFPTNNPYSSINAIELKDNKLLIGGLFNYTPLSGNYSQNYAEYDLIFNTIYATGGSTNESINDIVQWDNEIIIGGDFTRTSLSSNASYLAKTSLISSTEVTIDQGDLTLFPNPAKDILNIEGLQSSFEYEIIDIQGSVIQKGTSSTPNIQLNSFMAGVYIINIAAEAKSCRLKFVKQ